MRYVELSEEERVTLEELFKHHSNARQRQRAQGLLLSVRGFSIDEIARIYEVDRDTVSSWFTRWDRLGLVGLQDAPRSDTPPKLSGAEQQRVLYHPLKTLSYQTEKRYTEGMMQLINKNTPRVLSGEIKKTKDEKYKTRLKAILLVKNGKTRKETAGALAVSLKSVTGWVKTYNKDGLRGLKSKKTGRPKGKVEWDAAILERLAKEIDKSNQYWSIPLMQRWIREEEKKDIPESTLWYRITQIGYSNKSSRPYPYRGDKEKQEAFKKGALRE